MSFTTFRLTETQMNFIITTDSRYFIVTYGITIMGNNMNIEMTKKIRERETGLTHIPK